MSTESAHTPVDTAHVAGRRKVRYHTVAEILRDAEELRSRGYRRLGNWSLGQMTKHIAGAMRMALDGSPMRVPLPMRLAARWLYKDRVVRGPMKAGFKLPRKAAALLPADTTSDDEGIAALRVAIARWDKEPRSHVHPFFGKLTADEWDAIMRNHAAMHMSFLLPN